jgi:hypothetical protein
MTGQFVEEAPAARLLFARALLPYRGGITVQLFQAEP